MKEVIRLLALCSLLIIGFILLAHPGSAFAKCIGKDQVNIRSGPSLKSRVIFVAPLGYPIEIQKREGDWVLFRDWENNTAWVHKLFVSDIEAAVILVNANVRSSAGIQHDAIAQAKRGEIYRMIERKGNWVYLGYFFGNEPFGWVRSDLVFGD